MYNNIYALNNLDNCDGTIRSSPASGSCNETTNKEACNSFTLTKNIMYINNTFDTSIFYETTTEGFANETINSNTYWSVVQQSDILFPGNVNFTQWQDSSKQDLNSVINDPMFGNIDTYNFTLKSNSPALKLGFEQIDTNNIGPSW